MIVIYIRTIALISTPDLNYSQLYCQSCLYTCVASNIYLIFIQMFGGKNRDTTKAYRKMKVASFPIKELLSEQVNPMWSNLM